MSSVLSSAAEARPAVVTRGCLMWLFEGLVRWLRCSLSPDCLVPPARGQGKPRRSRTASMFGVQLRGLIELSLQDRRSSRFVSYLCAAGAQPRGSLLLFVVADVIDVMPRGGRNQAPRATPLNVGLQKNPAIASLCWL